MLKLISKKCTEILIIYKIIALYEVPIFQYGFELLFSTIICISSIVLIGFFSGSIHLTLVFLLFFIPIRIAAGGYHAGSYKNCFIMSNLIAFMVIQLAKLLSFCNTPVLTLVQIVILMLAVYYIWKNAPVNIGKYLLPEHRVKYNRKCAHQILVIEMILIMIFGYFRVREVWMTAVITCYFVAIMMKFGKGEEIDNTI